MYDGLKSILIIIDGYFCLCKLIKEIESKKATNEEIKQKYDILQNEYENYLNNVQKEKEEFIEKQKIYNKTIDERVDNFQNKEATELEYYYKNSVMLSSYPIIWEKDVDLKYDASNKCITVDYKLPLLSEIYDIEKITYSVSKDEYTVVLAKEKQLKQDYNNILYQICLRTIYELFTIDSEINGINKITFNGNITFLRILRVLKLFRIAKLARYTTALEKIKKSFAKRKDELIVTLAIFFIGLTISSIAIYFAECNTGNKFFASIPSSFWWSVVTCTSVGYGDAYPVTTAGKFIGALTAIMGVGLHALLIGVVGAAFIEITREEN